MKLALNDLSIRTRVALLAALPVLGVLALVAVHWTGNRTVAAEIATARASEDVELHASKARYLFANLRQHENEFLAQREIAHAERYRNTARGLHDSLVKLGESPLTRAVAKRIELVREKSQLHAADFEQVVEISQRLGLEADAGLSGQLRRSAQAIEAEIRGIQDADRALLAQLLTLRRIEKNYIIFQQPEHLESFDDERTRIDWLIGTAKLPATSQATLRSQLDSYQNTFRAWAQASHERNLHLKRLSESYRTASVELLAVFGHIDELHAASQRDLNRALESVSRFSMAIAAGLLVIIILLAYFVARGIVQPIRAITETFNHLSDGNVDIQIDGQERRDEFGELSRKLADFRTASMQAMRSQATFDATSASITVVDTQGFIIAVNQAAAEMFRMAEPDLKRVRPDFDINAIVGQPINRLVTGLTVDLDRVQGKHALIGRRAFDLVMIPVFSKHGVRLGAAIEWNDKTEQLAIEEEVARIVKAASAGDFSQRLNEANKNGFMLELTKSMNELIKTVELSLSEIVTMLAAMADGNVNKRMEGNYSGIFLTLKTDANRMSAQVRTMAERITRASAAVKDTTRDIGAGVGDLSARTEQQASSLEETAASLEELSATVRQNAGNAEAANLSAVAARERAAGGGKIATLAIGAMGKIEESSRQITEIVALIEEIAFQTNILALNAAVEAARAGDAGRGFAVVANEVRALAQRSGQALKDVKGLIANSDSKIKEGVALVSQAGTSLTEIVQSVKEVADLVSEIAAASREQSSGLDQVSRAVTNMDQMTQENAALVEETNAALHSAHRQVDDLLEAVEFFKVGTIAHEEAPAAVAPTSLRPPRTQSESRVHRPMTNPVHRQHQLLARSVGKARPGTATAILATQTAEQDDWREF